MNPPESPHQIIERWKSIRTVCYGRPQLWLAWLHLLSIYPQGESRTELARGVGGAVKNITPETVNQWARAGLVTLSKSRPPSMRPGQPVITLTATPKLFKLLRFPLPA